MDNPCVRYAKLDNLNNNNYNNTFYLPNNTPISTLNYS